MKETKSSIEMKKTILIVLISLILVALVVVGLIFLLNGKTTTTGNKTSNEKSETLVCSGTNIDYPKLQNYKNPTTETKVTIIFDRHKLSSIGLLYTLNYDNTKDAKGGETVLANNLGSELGKSGLEHSSMNNKFNTYENTVTLNLFSKSDELNEKTAPYFLFDADSGQINNWTIEDYKNNYTGLGFSCEKS